MRDGIGMSYGPATSLAGFSALESMILLSCATIAMDILCGRIWRPCPQYEPHKSMHLRQYRPFRRRRKILTGKPRVSQLLAIWRSKSSSGQSPLRITSRPKPGIGKLASCVPFARRNRIQLRKNTMRRSSGSRKIHMKIWRSCKSTLNGSIRRHHHNHRRRQHQRRVTVWSCEL